MPPASDLLVAPAFLWVPEHTSSAADEVADLAELAGMHLDGEQRMALEAILAEGPDGRWAALETALVCSRQNLKTYLLLAIALGGLFLLGEELIVWTAHLFPTAMEAFRDVKQIIDGAPDLSREVKRISEANGEEGIELHSGQRLLFKARTKTGGRGLTGDRVILDEAFALGPSEMGSLLPALSARPNPQVNYASSAGMVTSDILRNLRDRGRPGGDASLVWVEWCAPEGGCASEECDHRVGAKGCVLDDPARWQMANPALGRRIRADFIAAERKALPTAEFARERLGWWEDPVEAVVTMPLADWEFCADRGAAPTDPVVFGVDVAPNHTSASVTVCGGPVELIEHHRGTSWVLDRLVELKERHVRSRVACDPAGPVGSLLPDMIAAGLDPRLLDGRESVQACGQLYAAVLEHEFRHKDQAAMNDAVGGAVRRQVGDAWKWSRKDSTVDISPLVAATVARFVWMTEPLHDPQDAEFVSF